MTRNNPLFNFNFSTRTSPLLSGDAIIRDFGRILSRYTAAGIHLGLRLKYNKVTTTVTIVGTPATQTGLEVAGEFILELGRKSKLTGIVNTTFGVYTSGELQIIDCAENAPRLMSIDYDQDMCEIIKLDESNRFKRFTDFPNL